MSRKRKFIPVEEAFAEWRKDPEYVAAYDALEEESALIHAHGEADMTQEEVAKAMGTTQAVVARLESGRVMPSTRRSNASPRRRSRGCASASSPPKSAATAASRQELMTETGDTPTIIDLPRQERGYCSCRLTVPTLKPIEMPSPSSRRCCGQKLCTPLTSSGRLSGKICKLFSAQECQNDLSAVGHGFK